MREPTLRFVERLAAPQQARRPPLRIPLLRRRGDLREERAVFLILVEPTPQRGPALDQRLVHDLDRAAAGVAARLHDQQARRDELIDHARELAVIARERLEIDELDDRARALGGDER